MSFSQVNFQKQTILSFSKNKTLVYNGATNYKLLSYKVVSILDCSQTKQSQLTTLLTARIVKKYLIFLGIALNMPPDDVSSCVPLL